jgi:hypothetical protein
MGAAAPGCVFDIDLHERRVDVRVNLSLAGRYNLGDCQDYPCWTLDVSPSGLALLGIERGRVGDRVIAYINQLGRIEGTVARHFGACLGVRLITPSLKREKLKEQIAWLAAHRNGKPNYRRFERIAPYNRRSTIRTADGGEFVAVVADIAPSGAALRVDATPQLGSQVKVGRASARVVRHLQDGIAVEFIGPVIEAAWMEALKTKG